MDHMEYMERILIVLVLSLPTYALNGSYTLKLISTYIPGETQFPKFSIVTVLDDIIVGYYNSVVYIPRGNTTNEDKVIKSDYIKDISDYMHRSFKRRSNLLTPNESLEVFQTLVQCELLNSEPGKMIVRDAAGGSTTDELTYHNNNFTYLVYLNHSREQLKPHLDAFQQKFKEFYYPTCIDTLRNYLKKRTEKINNLRKPTVKFFQKANTTSGGFQARCLATGFYPRHINLTLLRDGQPVADHEVTGGNLLPNDDGTYQMRKILEISAEEQREKHTYTCTATHLSLDNKLDVELNDYLDKDHYSYYIIGAICGALMLLLGVIVSLWLITRQGGRYDFAAAAEESDEDAEL